VVALEMISQRLGGQVAAGLAKTLQLQDTEGTKFLSSHGPMDELHLNEISSVLDSITDPKVGNLISNAVAVNFKLFAAMLS
jgi:hypothetical protein